MIIIADLSIDPQKGKVSEASGFDFTAVSWNRFASLMIYSVLLHYSFELLRSWIPSDGKKIFHRSVSCAQAQLKLK